MISLEEQLAAGMREHTSDAVPPPDILDRAVRANRRRSTRLAAIGSGLAVVAVLAAVFGATRTPQEKPPPAASATPSPQASPLAVGEVTRRALDALSSGDVEQAMISRVYNGVATREEVWFDPVNNDLREHEATPRPGSPELELWHIEKGNIHVQVDHTARTWASGSGGDPLTTKLPFMPTALRAKLTEEGLSLGGREVIGGHLMYRLELVNAEVPFELWVDADTFQVRRLRITQPGPGITGVVTMDIEWLPRTPTILKQFEFSPPPGYRKVAES